MSKVINFLLSIISAFQGSLVTPLLTIGVLKEGRGFGPERKWQVLVEIRVLD